MKKSLVLTAIAATLAAPAAFAQSSVTIYGRLNVAAESQKIGDGDRNNVIQDYNSRIGFKGEEDLGGGMKGLFLIESGFDASTGKSGSAFWGRESWVGLATRFGTVKLGNMSASEAYYATADWIGMHNHDTGPTEDAFYSVVGAGSGTIAYGNLKNAVAYYTPVVAGFVGHAQVAEATAGSEDKIYSGAVNYDRGPLHLGLGYEQHGDDKQTVGRAVYELGAFTFGGYYGQVSGDSKHNIWRVSGMYTLGNNELHLNYGQAGKIDGVPDSGANQWTAQWNYNLSKRTKVYAFYSKLNNDDNAAYQAFADAGSQGLGQNFSSYGAGIRHNF
ncbi:porin [Ideonella azotifigens]|uniref:Porin n=1 Tax=Ideonella azotifigens TaxID=513160 RepID=A0ABP3VT94_9BURK|nr:porin [Ideonella azotifigens]MCD2344137.1 porin [Ideonella azotifigens]